VEDEDTFIFNEDFVAPLFRIKVVCACCLSFSGLVPCYCIIPLHLAYMVGAWDFHTDSLSCLMSGQCDTAEGNCRGKHEYDRASVSGSPISGPGNYRL
jgi:hypothetical protein